jgi:D-3-phosphoglycerate dehydrogenase
MRILITPTSFKPDQGRTAGSQAAFELLRSFSQDLVFNPLDRPLTEDELIPLLKGCSGFIAGVDFITRKAIENTQGLKVISRYGVGFDRVDLEAAKEKGIIVCNTPGANANAVADLTFALLLSIIRKVPILDRKTREGQWPRSTGIELFGKTIGILGLGAVGKAVAKRATGFSMRIIACDPVIDREYVRANSIAVVDFDTVVREADFLCLHLPLTNETRDIISADVMHSMKKGAVIVNTARGGIIDEAAAYAALKSGHLGGLGLDVFEAEPPPSSPFFELENVVLTPHTAAHTIEAVAAMAELSVKNLIDVLSGKECRYIVN